VLGIVMSVLTFNPAHLMAPQVVALLIMALGAWIDSHTTNLIRPEEMYVSQAMLAFGGVFFLGPLLLTLMGSVISNPANLITFSVLFGLTQNLGGLLGAALLGTWQVTREKFHASNLADHLSSLDPLVAARIQQGAGAYGRVLADPSSRTRQGISVLGQVTTREANILAYNDVFMAIAVLATLLAAWIFGRALWLQYVAPPAPAAPQAPATQAGTQSATQSTTQSTTQLSTAAAAPDSATDSPIATAAGEPPEPVPADASRL
jgi:hypothetical protein